MAQANPNQLGALWVNEAKSDRSLAFTGEINGQRMVVFKNKRWSEAEAKKQPLYHILQAVAKGTAKA